MLRRARPSILNLNFAALPKQASAGFAFRAPMDFTGERFIPGQGAAAIAYEHVARYLLAQPLAAGLDVLDLGSGEGYGSQLLSIQAAFVIGVDVSWEAIREAAARYAARSRHIRFLQGSATALPLGAKSVDLVVAFEILEHLSDHDAMLAEVRRVLRPRGMLLISTPNKAAYSDAQGYQNPFHVKELYFEGFHDLLHSHFPVVRLLGQKNLTGSLIAPIEENDAAAIHVRRIRCSTEGAFETASPVAADHMYFIAICSESEERVDSAAGIVLADRNQRSAEEAEQFGNIRSSNGSYASHETIVADALLSALGLAGSIRRQAQAAREAAGPEEHLYDLIVPNFNAPDTLKRCLDSLIANTDPKHLIHVIDDASTDPRVDPMLRAYAARHGHIRYYRLPQNLGFPGAVNAGFASTTRDVVIINADTEFPRGWLARMDRCRRSDPAIHAISPLSNNATLCSVPHVNHANRPRLPLAEMDDLVQRTSLRRYPRVPTAVGFCMLMTREAIDAVGPFDMIFGRGYGEEVDWCQRAWSRGFESAVCDDVYVLHHGAVAFSQISGRDALREENQRRFEKRWPGFDGALARYFMRNPLRYQQHRLLENTRHPSAVRLRVLHVTHSFDQAAGVEMFTRQLVDGTRNDIASTVLFPGDFGAIHDAAAEEEGQGLLTGGLLKVCMNAGLAHAPHEHRGVGMTLRSTDAERFFADVVTASNAQIVQFSHLAGLGSLALPLIAKAAGASVVIVLHDYFLLCPDWNLLHASGVACGETRADGDSERCVNCLATRIRTAPGFPALDLDNYLRSRTALVREVLECADVLIAPSTFVRDQFVRAWGPEIGKRIRIISHGTPSYPAPLSYQPQEQLRVAFLGNTTAEKGIETFVAAANRLRHRQRIQFRVLGRVAPGAKVGVHDNVDLAGDYTHRELSRLLQDVDVAYIGSIVHESFCYTVDEAFRAGVPVIASEVGAIPERIADRDTGFLIRPGDVSALCETLERLDDDRTLLNELRSNIAGVRLRSVEEEVAEYLGLYRDLSSNPDDVANIRTLMKAAVRSADDAAVSLDDFLRAKGVRLTLPLTPVELPRRESPDNRRKVRR